MAILFWYHTRTLTFNIPPRNEPLSPIAGLSRRRVKICSVLLREWIFLPTRDLLPLGCEVLSSNDKFQHYKIEFMNIPNLLRKAFEYWKPLSSQGRR